MSEFKKLNRNMYKIELPKKTLINRNLFNSQIKRKKEFLNNIIIDKNASDLFDDLKIDKINIKKWNHLSKVNQFVQKTSIINLKKDKESKDFSEFKEICSFSKLYKGQKVFSVYIADHNVGEIFSIGNGIKCIMTEDIKLNEFKSSDLYGRRIKTSLKNISNPLFHVFPVVLNSYYGKKNTSNSNRHKLIDFKRSPLILRVKKSQISGEIFNYSGRKFHSTNYWVNFDS